MPRLHYDPVAQSRLHAKLAECSDETLLDIDDAVTFTSMSRKYLQNKNTFPAPMEIGPKTFRWKLGECRAFCQGQTKTSEAAA